MKEKLTKITRAFTLIFALSFINSSQSHPLSFAAITTLCGLQKLLRSTWCATTASTGCDQIWEEPFEVACENTVYLYIGCSLCLLALAFSGIKQFTPKTVRKNQG